MEGAIILSRAIVDSEVFASEKLLKVWVWLLIRANHSERPVPVKIGNGQSVVNVKRGQLLFGRHTASRELAIGADTVYKCIKKLEKMNNIITDSNNHYTLITICNYDYYQDLSNYKVTAKPQPSNSQVTAEPQLRNTNNNDKNDNNEKNNIPSIKYLSFEDMKELESELLQSEDWLTKVAMRHRTDVDNVRELVKVFCMDLDVKEDTGWDLKHYKSHLSNWVGFQLQREKEFKLKTGQVQKEYSYEEVCNMVQLGKIKSMATETQRLGKDRYIIIKP